MEDKLIAAKGCVYSSDCAQTGLNNNRIIVGGSGSGKTMSITEPCLLHSHNRNLIVTVTKSRVIHQYAPLLRSRGYRVEVLDFADLEGGTVGYDPLHYVQTEEEVRFLAQSMVMADPRKRGSRADPYWDDTATNVLCALIHYELLRQPPGRRSFAHVVSQLKGLTVQYHASQITTNLDVNYRVLELEHPGNPATAHWESFCHLPGRTAACVISALLGAVSYLFNEQLLAAMSRRPVDFRDMTRQKMVLFLVTSPVNPALSQLVGQFYSTAMKTLFELAERRSSGQLPIPVHMICDDFATGAPIPNFAQYISIIREKGLSVTLLCQSESQLESIYSPAEATTVINNCDTYVFTGGMDLKTARSISQRLNRAVDEVLSMPLGQFAVFRRGQRPVLAPRYPILEDPVYVQQFLSPQQEREELLQPPA